ncbi:MAG: ribonuclease P protein component [Verrucomicrobiales bacterium]|nr:ribonuclease P protein component [Verrucomicrobiales bacterium]
MKFPRSRRITSRADFQRVRTDGKSIRGKFLVLGFLHDPERVPNELKVGLITTKRLGGAVTRNAVRRKLRGILQRTGDLIKPGHLLVLIARNQAAEATSEKIEKEWNWLLRKAKLRIPAESDNPVPEP